MSKTVLISNSPVTFQDHASYKDWLEHHDYSFVQVAPVSDSDPIQYAIQFEQLHEGVNYIPVKRPLHNARIGLDAVTMQELQEIQTRLIATAENDAIQGYSSIREDFRQLIDKMDGSMLTRGDKIHSTVVDDSYKGYQHVRQDMLRLYHSIRHEIHLFAFLIAGFVIFCIVLYFLLQTYSNVLVHKFTNLTDNAKPRPTKGTTA
jgi:hypothetical protein